MLILSAQDMLNSLKMDAAMDAVEEAYLAYATGRFQMPTRMHVSPKQKEGDTLLLMPCFTEKSFGTKIVTVFPDNTKKNTPVIQGLMLINDLETGEPLALMNGMILTALKTGAVGGVSIRHLAKQDARSVGLIGTGVQGLYQLVAACSARDIQEIYLYNRSPNKIPNFIHELRSVLTKDVNIHIASNVSELVKDSDIIITSTTSSTPVLPDHPELFSGKHIVGIGSFKPTMQEFSKALYQMVDTIYIDALDALHETGDITEPIDQGWLKQEQIIPFSKVIHGEIKPNVNISSAGQQTTVFKSVGMALFDLFVAQSMLEKAEVQGLGQRIQL